MPVMNDYEKIVHPHLASLKQYCFYLTRSKWDGEDLYQETLMKSFSYYKKRGDFVNCKALLFQIARHLWIDQYRKKEKRTSLLVELCRNEIQMRFEDNYIEIRFLIEWLAKHLTKKGLSIWLLSDYFGYTMQEIAEQAGATVSAVKSSLFRAREKIRMLIRSMPKETMDRSNKKKDIQIENWVHTVIHNQPHLLVRQMSFLSC